MLLCRTVRLHFRYRDGDNIIPRIYKLRIYVYRFSRRIDRREKCRGCDFHLDSVSVGLSRPPGTSVRRKNEPPLWILRLVKEDSNRSAERCRLGIWTRTRYEGSCVSSFKNSDRCIFINDDTGIPASLPFSAFHLPPHFTCYSFPALAILVEICG